MTIRERFVDVAVAENKIEARRLFVALCARDPVYFINTCCWTFDPRPDAEERNGTAYSPFLLFEKQEEMVCWVAAQIEGGDDFLIEKSRDVGATWLLLAIFVWFWLFKKGSAFLVSTYKEDLIDRAEDPDTLFWKIEFLILNLPGWMRPEGYGRAETRSFAKIYNPITRSSITGQAPTTKFGRSGRRTAALFDELAFWDSAEEAWNACSQTTPCRIAMSTSQGMNFFGRLANGRHKEVTLPKFRIHWKDDPRHNHWIAYAFDGGVVAQGNGEAPLPASIGAVSVYYPWYERQKKRYPDPAKRAQELDIDYEKSVSGRYYPTFDLAKPGLYPYTPGLPLYVAMDYGLGDATAILWAQWDGRNYRAIDYYENSGHRINFYIPFLTGAIPGGSVPQPYTDDDLLKIQAHRMWRVTEFYGDPAGKLRNQVTGTSVIDELATAGIYVVTNDRAREHRVRREEGMRVLERLVYDQALCGLWAEHMRMSRFQSQPENTNSTAIPVLPVHDVHSHGRSAFEYLAVNDRHLEEPFDEEMPDIDNDPQAAYIRQRMLVAGVGRQNEYQPPARGIAGY